MILRLLKTHSKEGYQLCVLFLKNLCFCGYHREPAYIRFVVKLYIVYVNILALKITDVSFLWKFQQSTLKTTVSLSNLKRPIWTQEH